MFFGVSFTSIWTETQLPIEKLEICHVTNGISHSKTEDVFTTGDGHFLQATFYRIQTASCHNYGSRWSEREREREEQMDKQTFTQYFSSPSFTQCLWFVKTSGSNVVGHLPESSFDFDALIFFLLLLQKCDYFFPRMRLEVGVLQNGIKHTWRWEVWFGFFTKANFGYSRQRGELSSPGVLIF